MEHYSLETFFLQDIFKVFIVVECKIHFVSWVSGVDVVLNSLAEEKLQASIRCLARHGRFLEIGKYDLSNNSALGQ